MNRFLFILLSLGLFLRASAQTFSEGGIVYTQLTDTTVSVTSNANGYTGVVTVPATVEHDGTVYAVRGIDDRAFQACTSLTSVILPEGLTTVGGYAFNQCSALDSVALPSTLNEIGRYAFNQCTSLRRVALPRGITEIPQGLFYMCISLTNVTLPDGLTAVGRNGFSYCAALASLQLPASCTSLDYSPFNGCGFTKFEVPEGVTLIPAYCFSSCHQLANVTLPATVDSLASCAFQDCPQLTTVSLPASLRGLGKMAFASCMGLKSIYVPDGVAYVDKGCFYNCAAMERVTLGKGVSMLGDEEFTKYKNTASMSLKDLYIFSHTMLGGGNGFDEALYAFTTVHVPASMVEQYQQAEGWKRFTILPLSEEEVTGVDRLSGSVSQQNAFYNLKGQQVAQPVKGLYIHNGKKYFKR